MADGSRGRVFVDTEAKRCAVPLLIGLVGPSGSGKTYSALRLATGVQRVSGGEIFVIDTEAKRALHYARGGKFKFRHVPFEPPFEPGDYLAAIEHCAKKGAKVVVIDSMSHEHEGPGGVLEMHAAELDRLTRGDDKKRNSMTMMAWQRPKAERRRMVQGILQLPLAVIMCFRGKPKLKMVKGRDPEQRGFMAIAGEELMFELTMKALMLPQANGVPTWESDFEGEQATIKLPEQFRDLLLLQRGPLSEDIGESMARWASAEEGAYETLQLELSRCAFGDLDAVAQKIADAVKAGKVNDVETRALRAAFKSRKTAGPDHSRDAEIAAKAEAMEALRRAQRQADIADEVKPDEPKAEDAPASAPIEEPKRMREPGED